LWLGEISRNRNLKRRELLVIGCWLSASSRFTVVSSQSEIGVHLPLRSFLSVPSVSSVVTSVVGKRLEGSVLSFYAESTVAFCVGDETPAGFTTALKAPGFARFVC